MYAVTNAIRVKKDMLRSWWNVFVSGKELRNLLALSDWKF
ncbi:hypothetical protein LR69_04094 [Geobacillus sp. BCO2]|nr:hypothetical protein LR69_04094 [Geobacillus sp. BCO2]